MSVSAIEGGARTAIRIGRRERNKRDKLARIKHSARKLFARQGVDATTIRQIADAADIGLGTMFSYAASKEDLLVMIFQEEVGRALDRAFARVPEKPLLNQILHILSAIVTHHRENPGLARVFVKETPFIADSHHSIAAFMSSLYLRLAKLIDNAKDRGEFPASVPSIALARNLFAIFFQQLQFWLAHRSPAPDLDHQQLNAALELQLIGLRNMAAPAAVSGPRAARHANDHRGKRRW